MPWIKIKENPDGTVDWTWKEDNLPVPHIDCTVPTSKIADGAVTTAMWTPKGDGNVWTEDSDDETKVVEEEDGQYAWFLPKGRNPVVNGKRCTCGVAVAMPGSPAEFHSDWCQLKEGGKND